MLLLHYSDINLTYSISKVKTSNLYTLPRNLALATNARGLHLFAVQNSLRLCLQETRKVASKSVYRKVL